jgi:hypothetical protein
MRRVVLVTSLAIAAFAMSTFACSGNSTGGGFAMVPEAGTKSSGGGESSSSGSSGGGNSNGSSSGNLTGNGSAPEAGTESDASTVVTIVYAHSDNTLYEVNPTTNAVTMIGAFAGLSGGSGDSAITDLAVDGNNDVYVNSESVLYKAAVPASPGTVQLTKIATLQGGADFYALAFAPPGALDANNETLVGGDGDGNLWYINQASGAATNLGNFGADPTTSGNIFELSGDIVFYLDPNNNNAPTGLATIRSCPSGGSSSSCSNDWLAGVDMANLKQAYTSGTAATTLLGGIYGGSSSSVGPGTGFHDVFGLAAWNSTVYGFTRGSTANLITIPTSGASAGVGTSIQTFSFASGDGWSGAGVTSKATINVPPPPPPPAQ